MESFLIIHIVELFWNYFVNYYNSQNNSKIIYRVNYEFLPSECNFNIACFSSPRLVTYSIRIGHLI